MWTLSASQQQSTERTLVMTTASALLLCAMALWLRYAARPIIPRPVLASWPIRCGVLSACGLYFGVALARFMLPLYLQASMPTWPSKTNVLATSLPHLTSLAPVPQTAMGWSQADTGLALMCQPLTLLLVGLGSGRLVKRIGARAQTALALLLLAAAILLLGAGLGSVGLMAGSMVLLATGQSLFNPANQTFVMACAREDQLSTVGALLGMCRSIALPLGIACCTALLSVLSTPLPTVNANLSHTNDAVPSPPSSLAVVAIDPAAARVTVWLYLLPTAAATAITLMRGEPRKTSCKAATLEAAAVVPPQTMTGSGLNRQVCTGQ